MPDLKCSNCGKIYDKSVAAMQGPIDSIFCPDCGSAKHKLTIKEGEPLLAKVEGRYATVPAEVTVNLVKESMLSGSNSYSEIVTDEAPPLKEGFKPKSKRKA
jgi:predicted  nucleic acid-binding Zn-ribbon protein